SLTTSDDCTSLMRKRLTYPIRIPLSNASPDARAGKGFAMRVGVIGLLQESNTFLTERTTLEKFQQDVLATGEAVRERFANSHHEIGGFFTGLADAKIEAVPIFVARALPFGVIEADDYL